MLKGSDPRIQNKIGDQAIDYAKTNGYVDIITLLKNHVCIEDSKKIKFFDDFSEEQEVVQTFNSSIKPLGMKNLFPINSP